MHTYHSSIFEHIKQDKSPSKDEHTQIIQCLDLQKHHIDLHQIQTASNAQPSTKLKLSKDLPQLKNSSDKIQLIQRFKFHVSEFHD